MWTFSNSGKGKHVRPSSLNNIQKLNFSTAIILTNILLTRPFQEKKKRNNILTQTLLWSGKFSIQYLLLRKEIKLVWVYVFLGNFKENFNWLLSVLSYCRGSKENIIFLSEMFLFSLYTSCTASSGILSMWCYSLCWWYCNALSLLGLFSFLK